MARSIATDRPHQARIGMPALVALLALVLTGCHVLALYEGPRWTSPLLIGDHLFSLALAMAIVWYGLALGRKVATPLLGLDGDRLTETLVALALGLGMLSIGILCAGFLRLYYPIAFLAGALALTFWLRDELRLIFRQASTGVAGWLRAGMPTAPTVGQRAVLLILLLALVTVFLRATAPVTGFLVDWDALAYHLPGPKLYLAAHSVIPLPDIPLANAPSSEEMLFLLGLIAGVDTIGKSLAVIFALLLGLATFAFGRRHFDQRVGWLSVLLLFSTFWIVIEMPLTLTDFASSFLLVLAASDALAWLQRRATCVGEREAAAHQARGPWLCGDGRLLLRAGVLIGLCVSYRLTSLPAVPALVFTVGLIPLLTGDRRIARRVVTCLVGMAVIGGAAVVALSPWLLKNLYFFHAPLYPATVATSTGTVGGGIAEAGTQTAQTSHAWWILSTIGQIGWTFAGHLTVLVLVAPFLLRRIASWAACVFLIVAGVTWLTFVPLYTPRYVLGPIAIAEVLTAAVACNVLGRLRGLARVGELVLVVYLLGNSLWVVGSGAYLLTKNQTLDVVLGSVSRYSYLAAQVRPYQAEVYVNEHTPPGAKVAVVGVTRGFYLDRPYLSDWYGWRLAKLESNAATRGQELALWCQEGVHYALFGRGDDQYDDLSKAHIRPRSAFAWLRAPGLQPRVLFGAQGVDVLAIDPCGGT